MASKRRGESETVNLSGFSGEEMRALVFAAWKVESAGQLPPVAVPALRRLQGGVHLESLSKVPRRSLQGLTDAIRPIVPQSRSFPETRAAFAKLDARLKSKRGRPVASSLWEDRARDAKRVAREWKRERGAPPSDGEIEAALGWQPGILRKWRNHKPGMFPPAA